MIWICKAYEDERECFLTIFDVSVYCIIWNMREYDADSIFLSRGQLTELSYLWLHTKKIGFWTTKIFILKRWIIIIIIITITRKFYEVPFCMSYEDEVEVEWQILESEHFDVRLYWMMWKLWFYYKDCILLNQREMNFRTIWTLTEYVTLYNVESRMSTEGFHFWWGRSCKSYEDEVECLLTIHQV
jgi:hypothetical protein